MADYASQVLADAPTTYWRLEETSGPTAVDSAAGATRPITLPGSNITYRVRGAFANGTSSGYALTGPNRAAITAIAVGTTATFEFWLIPTAGSLQYALILGLNAGGAGLYYDQTRNKVNLQVGGGAAGDRFHATALTPGTLYHVVVSIAAGTATFYINGVADGPAAGWPGISIDSLFNVGAGGAALVCGLIDEIAIYPTALSASQIAAHYAQALAASVSAPVSAGRQYLLGLPNAGVSSGTGPWVAVGYGSSRLLVTTIGTGTITAGSVQLEETDDPQDGSGATPMALGAAINCVSVSGNKKACTHLGPGAYGYIRARVSADVVGGGSVCLSLAGMP